VPDQKPRRKQDVKQEAAIKSHDADISDFVIKVAQIRTELGTLKRESNPEFFTIVELFASLAALIGGLSKIQLNQIEVCTDYVDMVLELISELQALTPGFKDEIKDLEKRVITIEESRKQKTIVHAWIVSLPAKITAILTLLITIATFWGTMIAKIGGAT